jgi:hypothetical protein
VKKRYTHAYLDGQLVRDLEYETTFVFTDRADGFRAQHHPEKMRPANEQERLEFERYQQPTKP